MQQQTKPHLAHDEAAERALLGACFLDGSVLDRVELTDESLYHPRHRAIYAACRRLREQRRPVDPVTVTGELGEQAAACGGLSFVSDLVAEVPTAANAEHYAAVVQHHATTRQVALAVGATLSSGLEGEELLGHALERLSAIGTRRPDGAIAMPALLKATWQRLSAQVEARERGDTAVWGLPTGLWALDGILGGLAPGVVTILAGRPSHGKSSLARSIADNVSAAGHGVHVFTLEDSSHAYALRALSDRGSVPLQRLRSLELQRGDMRGLLGAADVLSRPKWLVDDSAGLSAAQIAMRTRRHKRALATRLVVVDYVQLMREPTVRRRGDKGDEVAAAAESLVQLARDEQVAILLLSQLSRECEKREDKRPQLSDLRETGVLEQIADVVLFAYRPEQYLDANSTDKRVLAQLEKWRGKGLVIVGKNKHGPCGNVMLEWDAATATYRNARGAEHAA